MIKDFTTGIAVVNVIIMIISTWLVLYCYARCFRYKLPEKDHIFYSLKLQKCIAFWLFNLLALYVNYRIFYSVRILLPMDLMFLRYVDRGIVLIYCFYKIVDCLLYYPSAYEHKIKKKEEMNPSL